MFDDNMLGYQVEWKSNNFNYCENWNFKNKNEMCVSEETLFSLANIDRKYFSQVKEKQLLVYRKYS